MKIKRYLDFIKENDNSFNSLGEWIESLDDEYITNIVSRYIKDIDPTINLSNAINVLDERTQSEIKSQIDNYLENGVEEKEPDVVASTDLENITESAGKGTFNSFLKALTALGKKETNPDWVKCPEDFLLFYHYSNLESEVVKQIFNRFKSLSVHSDLIDYKENELNLFFGVKCNGEFHYGLEYDNLVSIGQFKISKSIIKWILSLESKSAQSLKKELVNLSLSDILILGKIKSDMKAFNPGYSEKKLAPIIKDRIITFGYYGIGKWDNGKLDNGEFMNIKNNLTSFILTKKWGDKVLINVKPESFWVYINIKLK